MSAYDDARLVRNDWLIEDTFSSEASHEVAVVMTIGNFSRYRLVRRTRTFYFNMCGSRWTRHPGVGCSVLRVMSVGAVTFNDAKYDDSGTQSRVPPTARDVGLCGDPDLLRLDLDQVTYGSSLGDPRGASPPDTASKPELPLGSAGFIIDVGQLQDCPVCVDLRWCL